MRRILIVVLALTLVAVVAGGAQAAGWSRGGPPPGPPQPRPESGYPPGEYHPGPGMHAPRGNPYLFLRGGTFEPNDERGGLGGYDTGPGVEVGVGSRLSPFLAVEGVVGSCRAEAGGDELRVTPVTLGARLILPGVFIEPYVGGGFGFYVTELREAAVLPGYSGIDDSSTAMGGYVSMGVDTWLGSRLALSLEGKYHAARPSFTSAAGNAIEVDVSGWALGLGIRLEF